jgi:predicted metal-dependent phosphoesterase TrpH
MIWSDGMATSDSVKRAMKKYAQTEKGKEARLKAVQKHQATEHGQEILKAAQERFEQTEARKAYRREWDRKNRARLRQEKKLKEENNNQ